MSWLLLLAGAVLAAGGYLLERQRMAPKPEATPQEVQEPVFEKTSYNPKIWFCERCEKEYPVKAPLSFIPENWKDFGSRYRPKVWECPRCSEWMFVAPVGWTEGDKWPPKR